MTPLTSIYEMFLSKIADYDLLKLTKQEIEEELSGYLQSAIARFYTCKKDLSITTDELGEKSFVSLLTPFEIEILITLMIVEYLKPFMLSTEKLEQLLSDKDFKIYSQSSQLREIRQLYQNFKVEAQKLITKYGYMGLGEES